MSLAYQYLHIFSEFFSLFFVLREELLLGHQGGVSLLSLEFGQSVLVEVTRQLRQPVNAGVPPEGVEALLIEQRPAYFRGHIEALRFKFDEEPDEGLVSDLDSRLQGWTQDAESQLSVLISGEMRQFFGEVDYACEFAVIGEELFKSSANVLLGHPTEFVDSRVERLWGLGACSNLCPAFAFII